MPQLNEMGRKLSSTFLSTERNRRNLYRTFRSPKIPMEPDVPSLVYPSISRLTIAAIAANIALGDKMEIAVEKAIDFVQGAIHHSYSLGKGNGPLNHLYRQRNLPFTPYLTILHH